LAGCTATLVGFSQPKGAWKEPEAARSGPDGRFELRFAPPLEAVAARVEAAGRVPMERRFPKETFKAGEILDAGELVLRPGCTVRGTVRDTAGLLQAGIRVYLSDSRPLGESELQFAQARSRGAETGSDGTFLVQGAVAPGEYQVVVLPSVRQREPARLLIAAGQGEAALDLVVLAELEPIEGLVADEAGRPVEGAALSPEPGGCQVLSGPDGAFRLPRLETQPDQPVRIKVEKQGFEPLLTEERYPWGASSVLLALRRGFAVEVRAVEAETGLPVEEFTLRHVLRSTGVFRESTWKVKNPQGRILVEDVLRGENVFVVEPRDERLWHSDPLVVRVADPGVPPQRIEVPRAGRASLVVSDRAGAPVAGTKVELLRPPPGVAATTTVGAFEARMAYLSGSKNWVLLLQAGATDAHGRLELRGPAGVELAVRLLGPGHVPAVRNGIVLKAEGGVLALEVAASAALKGVLLPPGLAARLQPPPGRIRFAKAAAERIRSAMLPGLRLVRPTGQERWPAGGVPRVPFEADGAFLLEGVPPGDWDVELVCAAAGDGQFLNSVIAKLGTIRALAPGETRRIELDASALLPATLAGRVFLDGEPAASTSITLLLRRPGRVVWGREADQTEFQLQTDGQGAFETQALPGSFTVAVPVVPGQAHRRAVCETWVQVGPGEAAARDFHIVRRKLAVLVLSAAGAPEAGRKFTLMPGRERSYSLTTDEHGEMVVDPAPLGPFELATWPRKLAGSEEQTAYIKAHPYPEWLSVLLRLGPIDAAGVRPGVRLELRLGPEPE